MTDGGGVAAFGFRYQYLATAEEFLLALIAHSGDYADLALIVEPTKRDVGDTADDDVVDFAIERDSTVSRRVQVKSSQKPSGMNPLRYPDAAAIFKRMGNSGGEVVILTNKPPAKKIREACAKPTRTPRGQFHYSVTARALTNGDASTARSVVHDERSPAEIKESLLSLIRTIRGDRALGQGAKTAALLAALLLDRIFESGADLSARRLAAQDILNLLSTPDTEIAHALRQFDWGVPLVEVPRLVSAVARASELNELTGLFTRTVTGRTPHVAVLTGVTGFGKSTIAADFCHLNRHFYEYVTWIDCRTDTLIEAKIKDTLTRLGVDLSTVSDVAGAFRAEMARLGGPFVLVFDGATQREDIERFIPTSGCGFVIVTTTNSTRWWSTASQHHIGQFTEDEAIACFEAHARIEAGVHTSAIAEIVNRLGRVPLAIAMAALHFRNVDEDITRLSAEYFDSLESLDDPASIPEDFDRTAFAAVRFAVSQLGKGVGEATTASRESQALIYHAAFLAPELIPLNLVLQTVAEMTTVDLTDPPTPHIADQSRRNGVLTNLRTQTIARRRNYVDASGVVNPASDTINIHPLVHELLRTIHRQLAPAERVIDLLTILMVYAYGWIISLGRGGAFFPLAQLLTHGEWILALVDDITPPPGADERQTYVFRCATAYLRTEIANAAASRGDFERSVATLEKVLNDVEGLSLTVHAQGMVAKVACDALADVMLGELAPEKAVHFARRAVAELTKLETFKSTNPEIGELIAEFAVQAFQAIARFDAPETEELAIQFRTIATRQAVSTLPSAAGIMQVETHLQRGEFVKARALVEQLRGSDPSPTSKIMFDNFETIADLYLGRWADATAAIDRILAIAASRGAYLHTVLQMACNEIGTALAATKSSWASESTRLGEQLGELRQLAADLAN